MDEEELKELSDYCKAYPDEFIENYFGIELTNFQKEYIKELVKAEHIVYPRKSARFYFNTAIRFLRCLARIGE